MERRDIEAFGQLQEQGGVFRPPRLQRERLIGVACGRHRMRRYHASAAISEEVQRLRQAAAVAFGDDAFRIQPGAVGEQSAALQFVQRAQVRLAQQRRGFGDTVHAPIARQPQTAIDHLVLAGIRVQVIDQREEFVEAQACVCRQGRQVVRQRLVGECRLSEQRP